MEEEEQPIPLSRVEAAWVVHHLLEAIESIVDERPLRRGWVSDSFLFAAVLQNRLIEAEGGGADPRLN